jgi:hypothetical protein
MLSTWDVGSGFGNKEAHKLEMELKNVYKYNTWADVSSPYAGSCAKQEHAQPPLACTTKGLLVDRRILMHFPPRPKDRSKDVNITQFPVYLHCCRTKHVKVTCHESGCMLKPTNP